MDKDQEKQSHSPFSLLWKGALFGIANIIPGVSGGTLAVITGVYDSLMDGIAHFIKQWKFLLFYLIGAGLGIIAGAFGLEKLFELWPQPTLFTFMGFILGGIPALLRRADFKGKVKPGWIIGFLSGFTLILLLSFFLSPSETQAIKELTPSSALWISLAGMAAASAMIIPGISGSFLLLLLGMYTTFVTAVKDFNLPILFTAAAGVAIGILLVAKVISFLLNKWHQGTYSVILGLVAASVIALWPGLPTGWTLVFSILFFAAGTVGGYLLGD